ncbi:MAG: peptidase M16 [Bacteroidetes bacterium HGW-Bacteroidetes-21]|nr:MAG: peptidase M16 [Bacteroidetes bacterium HGW-Bacteroidetes-21]
MQKINTHTSSNGTRLIHMHRNSDVAYMAVIINTGTRDEAPKEHGISHFIEHLIFKGTQKRKAWQILSRLEDVGGEVDAFTTKEDTNLFAAFPAKYFERTFDLFSDIIFNSIFPEKEIVKEREVIIDEINSYKDSPAEQIFDDFEEILYDGHPLGRNILGTEKSLKKIGLQEIKDFIAAKYNTDQIVVCCMGNVDFSKILFWFEKYFGSIPNNPRIFTRPLFTALKPQSVEKRKKTHQIHCVIGTTAYHYHDKRRNAFQLLNNILGGPGMNSRLNLQLREKNGLVYNIESSYSPYSDTGSFAIYFGAETDHFDKSQKLILQELKKLYTQKISDPQLKKAKTQFIGQLYISLESPETQLMGMGKTYLNYNQVLSMNEIRERIEEITAVDIIEAASILVPENLSFLKYY